MAKLKQPLLSLDAQGSLADSITFVHRARGTVAEKKPELPYFNTLPVQYQRWLYQDYAYLWRQQTEATKRQYAASGVRFHLTGFQYWMKYQLKNLPDIMAWYKMDSRFTAPGTDSSKYENTASVIGASPQDLSIDGALSFDGLNDYFSIPHKPQLENMTKLSLHFFMRYTLPKALTNYLLHANYWIPPYGFAIIWPENADNLELYFKNSLGVTVWRQAFIDRDTIMHLGFTWDGTTIRFYKDGTTWAANLAFSGVLSCTAAAWTIASYIGIFNSLCEVDNFMVHNRVLNQTEMARWTGRRYP